MAYNRFHLATVLHVVLFAVLAYLSVWAQFQEHLKFSSIGFGILAFLSISLLGFRVIRHNKRIIIFLRDHSLYEPYPKFSGPFRDRTFILIEQELNRLAASYTQVKLDKEAEHQLTKFIVEHIDTALFTIEPDGGIRVSNRVSHMYFPVTPPRNLDSLCEKHPDLCRAVKSVKQDSTQLIPIQYENQIRQILVKVNSIDLKGSDIRVCSLDDITGEMDKAEDRNWQKLLRILRHEIINSVAPVISLADSLIDSYQEQKEEENSDGSPLDSDPIYRGLRAIDMRSKGLISFVKSYKSLIEIPELALTSILLQPIFTHLYDLYKEELNKDNIELQVLCEKDLELRANEDLMIQVLVNLIRNAHDSLLNAKRERLLKISAERAGRSIKILVSDTGPGIVEDHMDQIFIPFFTTKEKGSGIGLSLSRQIINQLGGSMRVKSTQEETVFSLDIPISQG